MKSCLNGDQKSSLRIGNDDELLSGHTIELEDDSRNRTRKARHEKNISMPYLLKNSNYQTNQRTSKSHPQSILENLSHQSNLVGKSYSETINRYSNDQRNISGVRTGLRIEPKWEKNLTRTLLQLFENESRRFTGTDRSSKAMHLRTFIELGGTHEGRKTETILKLVSWTQGPGPKMVWDKFKSEPSHTWIGFLRFAELGTVPK